MFRPGIKTILLAIVLQVLVFVGTLVLMGPSPTLAGEPVKSWEIWHDGETKLYKIHDSPCTIYLARGYVNGFGGGAAVAMVSGPGCK